MDTKTSEMVKGFWNGTAEDANRVANRVAKLIRCPVGQARALVFRALTDRLPLGVSMTKGELVMSVAWYLAR